MYIMTKKKQGNESSMVEYIRADLGGKGGEIPAPLDAKQAAYILTSAPFHWLVALEWLYKLQWNNSYKLKYPKSFCTATKPQGLLLVQYLKLCESIHTGLALSFPPDKLPYPHAADWFCKVFRNLMDTAISRGVEPLPAPPDYKGKRNTKKNWLTADRKDLSLLKNGENPFALKTHTSDIATLIDAALTRCNRSQGFENDCWKPFLRQYTAWVKAMEDKCWRMASVQGNLIIGQAQKRIGKSQVCANTLNVYEKWLQGYPLDSPFIYTRFGGKWTAHFMSNQDTPI